MSNEKRDITITETQNEGELSSTAFHIEIHSKNPELFPPGFDLRAVSIDIDSIQASTSNQRPFHSLPVPGDHNVEGITSVGFVIDEHLNNISALTAIQHNNMVTESPEYFDIQVSFFTNNGNMSRTLTFYNCLITAVGGMSFSYDSDNPVITDFTVAYSHRKYS
jgi:hypothetical protein